MSLEEIKYGLDDLLSEKERLLKQLGQLGDPGKLAPILGMTPAQAAFNWAILPGWQRWKPLYLVGEITAIDSENDTADITFDDARSVAQNLPVAYWESYPAIPVEYMDCNSGAFSVGDRVVVEFANQNLEEPKVIGFEEEPRACLNPVVGVLVREPGTAPAGYDGEIYQRRRVPGEGYDIGFLDKNDEQNEDVTRLDDITWHDWDGITESSVVDMQYEEAASYIIFEEELAYRTLLLAGQQYHNVAPLAFTCGDYESVTGGHEMEFHRPRDRAVSGEFHSHSYIYKDGEEIYSGYHVGERNFPDLAFVENITVPDYFVDQGFSSEEIANSCYPPGEYQLWKQGGMQSGSTTGSQVSLHQSARIDPEHQEDFGPLDAAAVRKYYYYGSAGGTTDYFEMLLVVNNQVYTLFETGPIPGQVIDDIQIQDFQIWDCMGKPVLGFAFNQWWWETENHIVKYGLWLEDEGLHFTDPIAAEQESSFFILKHDVFGSRSQLNLEGYGRACVLNLKKGLEGD